jgi:Asp-tRNA(Asn)/Glu-tRNA(Gln) amidotransferase A subunit family amidase
LSVPVMRDEASGMPVGVQLIGRPGHDAEILALAEVLERALGGFVDPEASPASALRQG